MHNLSKLSKVNLLPLAKISSLNFLDAQSILSAYLESEDIEVIETFADELLNFIKGKGENPFLDFDMHPLSPTFQQWEQIKDFLARKTFLGREINFSSLKTVLIQSVGKFDKNQSSIYEGHIIREYSHANEYSDFLIYYDVSKCAFMAYLIDSEDYGSYYLSSFEESEIEIIGHYLTDKDLLKNFDLSLLAIAKRPPKSENATRKARK